MSARGTGGDGASGGPETDPDAREDAVRDALRSVIDPEVGLDVVTMGLIYGVAVEGSTARVRHTLTARGCPMADLLSRAIAEAARGVPGVEEVETELVWEPPWHPGMIAEDAWDGER